MQFDAYGRVLCSCGGLMRRHSTERNGSALEVAFECPDCQRRDTANVPLALGKARERLVA